MGYYTSFRLSSTLPAAAKETVLQAFEQNDYYVDLSGNNTHKWYEWMEDCLKVSASLPGVLFKIVGVGEESDDLWWPEKTIRAHILPASWSQYHEDTEEGLEAAITYITCNTNFTREELSALWPNK